MPTCITGPAGTGKSKLEKAFGRLLHGNSHVIVDPDHSPFPQIAYRGIRVKGMTTLSRFLAPLAKPEIANREAKVRRALFFFITASWWPQLKASPVILTKARTDELAEGFQGRLKRLNQCTSNKSLLDKLNNHFGLEGQGIPKVGILAKAAGLDITDFCRGHTLIPYQRAVTDIQPDVMHGDPVDMTSRT